MDLAVSAHADDAGQLGPALGYGSLMFLGLAFLLVSVWYERWVGRHVAAPLASGRARAHGPGAPTVGELSPVRGIQSWSAARPLSLLIAVGIGLHNFAEGLAIGQSAAAGEIGLALMLVIGFGLHGSWPAS